MKSFYTKPEQLLERRTVMVSQMLGCCSSLQIHREYSQAYISGY